MIIHNDDWVIDDEEEDVEVMDHIRNDNINNHERRKDGMAFREKIKQFMLYGASL